MTGNMRKQEEVLEAVRQKMLFFSSFVSADESPPSGDGGEVVIQSCFDTIRQLKSQETPLRTKCDFTAQVLSGRPVEQLPQAKELAMAEGAFRRSKDALCDVKKRRVAAEARLVPVVEEVGNGVRRRDTLVDSLDKQLRARRAEIRASEVARAVAENDGAQMESLVGLIDEMDGDTCDIIIKWIRRHKEETNREAVVRRARVAKLTHERDVVRENVTQKSTKARKLEGMMERINGSLAGAPAKMFEIALQERMAGTLMAMTGVRAAEVSAEGVLKVAIDAAVLASTAIQGVDRKGVTHYLDVVLEAAVEGETEDATAEDATWIGSAAVDTALGRGATVRRMIIKPHDVDVTDLVQVPLGAAMSQVLWRLTQFIWAKYGAVSDDERMHGEASKELHA